MISAINSALSGLQTASKQVDASANKIANATNPNVDTVDLTEEAVKLITAEASYKANIASIKTANEKSEELLRVLDKTI